MSQIPFSPPPTTISSNPDPSLIDHHQYITRKSHRLRTSPIPGEGSTFVPVVKFTQPFTQRNALRGTKPVYGTALVEQPQEGDIVSLRQTRNDARTHGWTISITSSSPTDDDIQVEVQSHGEAPPLPQPQRHPIPQLSGHVLTELERVRTVQHVQRVQPRFPSPLIPPVPTLAHDRVIITKDDLTAVRTKAVCCLLLGLVFPPLWLIMGWGHMLDTFILPSTGVTSSREQVIEIYRPYRKTASVLACIVVLGTFVGMIVGALALGGVIA